MMHVQFVSFVIQHRIKNILHAITAVFLVFLLIASSIVYRLHKLAALVYVITVECLSCF